MTPITLTEDKRIDQLARDAYGTERNGNAEAIFKANPGLSAYGVMIPRGTVVLLPERPSAGSQPAFVTNPWD